MRSATSSQSWEKSNFGGSSGSIAHSNERSSWKWKNSEYRRFTSHLKASWRTSMTNRVTILSVSTPSSSTLLVLTTRASSRSAPAASWPTDCALSSASVPPREPPSDEVLAVGTAPRALPSAGSALKPEATICSLSSSSVNRSITPLGVGTAPSDDDEAPAEEEAVPASDEEPDAPQVGPGAPPLLVRMPVGGGASPPASVICSSRVGAGDVDAAPKRTRRVGPDAVLVPVPPSIACTTASASAAACVARIRSTITARSPPAATASARSSEAVSGKMECSVAST
mmetsp:Transcript_1144/g.3155  ORF Transcript_1144/g.3155 Transcript_1144/m.3155 type:complete len:284 (+) Transcript_1144:582-1433(+)